MVHDPISRPSTHPAALRKAQTQVPTFNLMSGRLQHTGRWGPGFLVSAPPHHPKVAQGPAGELQSHATMASDHFSVLGSLCHHASDKCCTYLRGLSWWGRSAGYMQSPQSMLSTIVICSGPHTALLSQRPINRSAPSSWGLKKKQ